jgi:peptidoglycan hydrolase-like protein with peptidoglycan-binding domain
MAKRDIPSGVAEQAEMAVADVSTPLAAIDLHQYGPGSPGLALKQQTFYRDSQGITMNRINSGLSAVAFATLAILVGTSPHIEAAAQIPATATSPTAPNESIIKALQEALNKQGITVKADGILDEETRAAIKKYQSQHHVPVTGEPDKATLDKLGVRQGATVTESPRVAQAVPTPSAPAQSSVSPMQPGQMPGGMMDCQAMHAQMQSMMQMMQGMMQTMQTMHAQMHPGQMQPGQMQSGATGNAPPKPN